MNIKVTVLSMTSVAALLGCRGDLLIGGGPDGGGGGSTSDDAGDPGRGAGEGGSVADSDASYPTVVGGICADALGTDASTGQSSCYCTRRPGPGASYYECAQGTGKSTSLSLGPSGATLTLDTREGTTRIDFPPQSVQTATEVTLTETSIAPPLDLLDWSPIYVAQPLGLTLAIPALINVPDSSYSDPAAQMGNPSPSDLSIWYSPDGSCFTRLPDSGGNAGFLTGTISQLGYLIVASARTPATALCP